MSRLTDEDVARGKAAIAAAYPRATPAPASEPAPLTQAQEARSSIHAPGCTREQPCAVCERIRAEVALWPILSAEQRSRLAFLLRGGAA